MNHDRFDAASPSSLDFDQLLDGCSEIGVQLVRFGGEIQRAEDTVRRLFAAYGLEGEVFAVPNCVWASVRTPDGGIHARMRRVPPIATNIEGIERLNALSRRLCAHPPSDPALLREYCLAAVAELPSYPAALILGGYFLGAFFFALFFSGGWVEAAVAGLAGLASGAVLLALGRAQANAFITTLASSLALAAAAYGLLALGAPINIEVTIAGGLMVLVPGLVFTSFMSDLLTGDMMAGLATFARAVLSAAAIALGSGAAMALYYWAFTGAGSLETASYAGPLCCVFAFVACLGFCPSFNVQGVGAVLCCLGGGLGWGVYLFSDALCHNSFVSTLIAAIAVSAYSEVMARVRKCPATSYLTIALFPLVPGLTIYQAMDHVIQGDMELFWDKFFRTFGIAGCIALGLLMVSSALDLYRRWKRGRLSPF